MIDLRKKGNRYILEFSQQDISDEFLQNIIRKYRIDAILNNNEMTEEEAWKISEEIKDNWYQVNKDKILKKIGDNNYENNC